MKDDFEAIGALCTVIGGIIAATLIFVSIAQYISNVAWRAGLTSNAAQWTIYVMIFLLCVGVTISILGRVFDGRWWWR